MEGFWFRIGGTSMAIHAMTHLQKPSDPMQIFHHQQIDLASHRVMETHRASMVNLIAVEAGRWIPSLDIVIDFAGGRWYIAAFMLRSCVSNRIP